MRAKLLTFVGIAGVALLVVNGCATQSYVQKQISDLREQMEANRTEIAALKSSDTAQNERLSELSDTVQDAIARVQQLREITKGKFLYEATIYDDRVIFGFDSSELSAETQHALDTFAARLKEENRDCYIEIQGHTDDMGPEGYNFQLGLDRARAVMSYLYVQHGIPLNRMNTYSYGASKPVADNSIASEKVKNRRVSLVVMTQATPLAEAQAEKSGVVQDEYVEQATESEPGHAVEGLTSKAADAGCLIQVGAYRSPATAENILKLLQDKGYGAYLDIQTLPELGLVHRVRIRGYPDGAAAKTDVERLKKEDGLSPFVLKLEAT